MNTSNNQKILDSNNPKNHVQTMRKYDSYKDSGVDWLGEIPKHWEVKRVKDAIVKIGSGVTPKGGSEVYVEQGIPFIRSQNVYDDGLRMEGVSFIDEETNLKMANSQVRPFDILLNITGASIGRTCIVPKEIKQANINQHILYLRFKKANVTYASWFLKSYSIKEYINLIQEGTSKEALNMGQMLNTPLLHLDYAEQTAIAQYLDDKTEVIDRKTNLFEKKIEGYKKLKKSLINDVVTGKRTVSGTGLKRLEDKQDVSENKILKSNNPENHVQTKDSGVDWIGQIPKHWEVKRFIDLGV